MHLLGTSASLWNLRRSHRRRSQEPVEFFPISILKPLKGVDPALEDNLRVFFQLDYSNYELLFSAADPDEPALAVARRLAAEYPGVNARFITGEVVIGPNAKVNNLIQPYDQAANAWLLISDSNARVEPDYLKRLAEYVEPGVGLVTSAVGGIEAKSLGGHLEALHLNTFYNRWMALSAIAGRTVVVGKSMLFHKPTLERFGGIRALGRYIAEDYMAGEAMRKLGMRVLLTSRPINQFVGSPTVKQFWDRHMRWGRIRRAQAPLPLFLVEPVNGSIPAGIMGALAVAPMIGMNGFLFFFLQLVLFSIADFLIHRECDRRANLGFFPIWLLREIINLPLWIHIAIGNTVEWRGKRYRVLRGGLTEAVE